MNVDAIADAISAAQETQVEWVLPTFTDKPTDEQIAAAVQACKSPVCKKCGQPKRGVTKSHRSHLFVLYCVPCRAQRNKVKQKGGGEAGRGRPKAPLSMDWQPVPIDELLNETPRKPAKRDPRVCKLCQCNIEKWQDWMNDGTGVVHSACRHGRKPLANGENQDRATFFFGGPQGINWRVAR